MAKCEDPSLWEIIFGLLGLILLGLLGAIFLALGIVAAVLGAAGWITGMLLALWVLCWLFAIVLALWLKALLDKLNRHLALLDRIEDVVKKAEEGLEVLFPEKNSQPGAE